jgi:hypothetical protein
MQQVGIPSRALGRTERGGGGEGGEGARLVSFFQRTSPFIFPTVPFTKLTQRGRGEGEGEGGTFLETSGGRNGSAGEQIPELRVLVPRTRREH